MFAFMFQLLGLDDELACSMTKKESASNQRREMMLYHPDKVTTQTDDDKKEWEKKACQLKDVRSLGWSHLDHYIDNKELFRNSYCPVGDN